jgi:2-aminoadipate transaminase
MRADGGCDVSAEDVLVTNGAKHALELVCRLLLDPGDAIVVTSPTYFTAIPIFKSYGVEFLEIPQDDEGLSVAQLEEVLVARSRAGLRRPKFIYDVPDFHNPTGITMSLRRREALVTLAERKGIFLVEDSPYRKVRFEGDSLPPWKALDRSNSVLTLGTFSKLLAPGMRVGWVAASPDLINRMIQLKSDGGSCPLTQRMILEFCQSGRLQGHIARVQQVYREHRDCMVAAVGRELPEAEMTFPHGGYYVWLTLPEHVDGDLLAVRARERNVIFIPGSKFFAATGTASRKRYIRLAYSHATSHEIDEGVKILGEVYRALD